VRAALGQLVGAAKEGLLALNVVVALPARPRPVNHDAADVAGQQA
jgi:hypothetical protein